MDKGIGSWLTVHRDQSPHKVALISGERELTYKQLNSRVNKLANSFLKLGVRKGDRINVLLFNSIELMETLFACAKIGAIFVPINYRLSVEEVEYIVRDSGAHYLIYEERTSQIIYGLRERVNEMNHYIYVGEATDYTDLTYEHLINQSRDNEPGFELEEHDLHMMMYTSGTTGKPKGAMLTHGNTLWNAINVLHGLNLSKDDITLTVAPLFHIGGMNILTTPLLYIGGTVVLQDVFQPHNVLEEIQSRRVTTLFLVPAMWMALINSSSFDQYDISSMKMNISGGAPCPITIIEFFQQQNIPFYEGFGLTETAPFVSLLDKENAHRKNGSVGKHPMHTRVRIVDEQDRDVEANQVGELAVKGPNVFAGYWNKPEETKQVMKEGWFHTGDLAKVDEEGFVYIVDRKKDMVVSGGENIYPIELEQVMYTHPNIQEVAVVGIPDEQWGEVPKAYIVLKNDQHSLSLESIKAFCQPKLAGFKLPKQAEFLDALPRNATGKILKTHLRKAHSVNR
ncbi:o-succinylbenzoate--CoA ligase [Pontibacillus yanchengensis]|uniref:o-succinylbenzoate--CoA ligase n=1 Tax=Pontibacillus yanchengensis TaxID=462910 RepID=UPI0013683BA0